MTTTTVRQEALQRLVVDRARDALSRAVRQALQALVPTLVVIAGGSSLRGVDLTAVGSLVLVTAFVSVAKSAANLKLPATAPIAWQLTERAVVAAGGTAAGLAVAGLESGTSIAWEGLTTASVGAAVLAVVMYFTNPPVVQGEIIAPPVEAPRIEPDREPSAVPVADPEESRPL
ncbi:hypothetical protein [Kineosporia babensis]|uniref:Holin n=1 Tax=Kineosporia babensis TaxID=499548 RepID=A0A9X1SSL4_9ACTN|nr:hypothetical protein [Kineosporia babensis]MCD5310782.1 hypothetical protein [Kineosporia babensis]